MPISLPPTDGRADMPAGKIIENMYRKVEAFCLRQGLMPCRRLLIALSGGADSVTLLHLMKSLQSRFGYELSAMHINHMIRGEEAKRDEDFCRTLCVSMGVDFHSVSVDVPALAAAEHRGLEETARLYRYAALNDHADAIGADAIATAHTASDQTETLLMQLIRGTVTAGGMRPKRGKLIRPLLEVTRDEIMAYIAENALPHVEDSSNADDRYTRNYIRHTVLPAIKAINPNAEEAFGRFANLRRAESDFLDSEAMRRLFVEGEAPANEGNLPVCLPVCIELTRVQALPQPLRARALAQLCERGGIRGLTHAHFEAMDALICKGKQGASLDLPSSAVARIEKGCFCLTVASPVCANPSLPEQIAPFELKMGENLLPDGSILFAYTQINENTEKYIIGKQNIYKLFINAELNFDKISNVIRVRAREAGDRILCRSMHRNVKKCFCDLHIPLEKRALQPILCDDEGLVWVPALRMLRDGVTADADTPSDRILHLIYMSDRESAY